MRDPGNEVAAWALAQLVEQQHSNPQMTTTTKFKLKSFSMPQVHVVLSFPFRATAQKKIPECVIL